MPSNDPQRVVGEYFRRMAAGESIADMWTEGVVVRGLGMRLDGRQAVNQFYADASASRPRPTVLAMAAHGPTVFAEISIELVGGSTLHVVDRFVVEGDRISELTYFVADD